MHSHQRDQQFPYLLELYTISYHISLMFCGIWAIITQEDIMRRIFYSICKYFSVAAFIVPDVPKVATHS